MLRSAVSIFAVLLLLSCATAPPNPAEDQQDVIKRVCASPGRVLGETRDSVTKFLGDPRHVAVVDEPNRHVPNVNNKRVTMQYPGLDIVLLEIPEHDRSFLALVRLRQNYAGIFPGLHIGEHASDLSARLPAVEFETSELARLECPGEVPPSLQLHLSSGRVREVEWINEPD